MTSANRTGSSAEGDTDGLQPPTVCFVTVDPSGDAIGAAVAEELRAQGPVRLCGVGGPAMRRAGIELLCDAMEWSALGVVAYLRVYWRARQGNHWIRRRLRERGNTGTGNNGPWPGVDCAGIRHRRSAA